jgi:hypothetical protein
MTFARAAAGFIVALVTVVAFAPSAAWAVAGTVLQADLVCVNVTMHPFSIIQSLDSTNGNLTMKLNAFNDLTVQFSAKGLPAGRDAQCAVLCVVDGVLDLFEFEAFVPCGTVRADGKLNVSQTVPLGDSFTDPFNGGCLLSIGAFLVPASMNQAYVCAPGFGHFASFNP